MHKSVVCITCDIYIIDLHGLRCICLILSLSPTFTAEFLNSESLRTRFIYSPCPWAFSQLPWSEGQGSILWLGLSLLLPTQTLSYCFASSKLSKVLCFFLLYLPRVARHQQGQLLKPFVGSLRTCSLFSELKSVVPQN